MTKTNTAFYVTFILISAFEGLGGTSECRQWCITKWNLKCSEVNECSIEPHIIKTGSYLEKPRPQPDTLHLSPECFKKEAKEQIGLRISWSIKGSYLQSKDVTAFYLTIYDLDSHSSTSSISVLITPNGTLGYQNYTRFDYFYDGMNADEGPEVVENERYLVNIESVPIFLKEHTPDGPSDTTLKLMKTTSIPITFKEKSCHFSDFTYGNWTTTPLTSVIMTDDTGARTAVLTLSIIIGLLLVLVVGVGIAAYKCRNQTDADSAVNSARAQNILILLNVEERVEVAKQTNWTATALSRVDGLGQLSVKYNRWETTRIAEIGIARWMRETVTWAHKVIISSTPDDLWNEERADIFERAFKSIMVENSVCADNETKSVFVVHFQKEEYHTRCPFMTDGNYQKFRLEEEWQNLCRRICAGAGSEQEPLRNSSHV